MALRFCAICYFKIAPIRKVGLVSTAATILSLLIHMLFDNILFVVVVVVVVVDRLCSTRSSCPPRILCSRWTMRSLCEVATWASSLPTMSPGATLQVW